MSKLSDALSFAFFLTSGVALLGEDVSPPTPPYPASPVIEDITFDWSTHRREAQGSDNWQLTWADDNQLYGAWGDGGGFGGTNNEGRARLGFARIEGDADNYRGYNVWGGFNAEHPTTFNGKSWGTTCVDGVLYSWVIPDEPDPSGELNDGLRDHYRYIELAKSTDHGATWTKASWRWWREDNVMIPTFLVYGRNNAGARDGYVYSYFIRPRDVNVTQREFKLSVHKPGALFLARARKEQMFDGRDAYEWFAGLAENGSPMWGPLSGKKPVFEDPAGTGWSVSASYNPALRRYFLATEHGATESSMLGLFDAPEPWGPWTTVKYWTPGDRFGEARPGSAHDWRHNVFFFSFVPKWLSADGRQFTISFTGAGRGKDTDSFNTVRGEFKLRPLSAANFHAPYPRSRKITGVMFKDNTARTLAPGSDIWPITWTRDDQLYTAWGDGGGFDGTDSDARVSLGVARIDGGKADYRGVNVAGGKNSAHSAPFTGKSEGILALDDTLYLWRDGDASSLEYFKFIELWKSEDRGATWRATEVRFSKGGGDFSASDAGIFAPAFCQFGRGYTDSRDDYVYIYAPDTIDASHWKVRLPGRINLLRVPRSKIESKAAYEFYGGTDIDGGMVWTKQAGQRKPVWTDAINGTHRIAVSYNAPLKRYLLTTIAVDRTGWMAIYDAPEPWGPWTHVHTERNPERWGELTIIFSFVNKWLSADGKDFVLVHTKNDRWATIEGHFDVATE